MWVVSFHKSRQLTAAAHTALLGVLLSLFGRLTVSSCFSMTNAPHCNALLITINLLIENKTNGTLNVLHAMLMNLDRIHTSEIFRICYDYRKWNIAISLFNMFIYGFIV